jgi:16S rRNA G966 N2-methylase RsmD
MAKEKIENDLSLIDALVTPKGEIVISRRHSDAIPEAPENWRVATDRRYGDTRILRYEKEAEKE